MVPLGFQFPDMHTRLRGGSRQSFVGSETFYQSRTQQGPKSSMKRPQFMKHPGLLSPQTDLLVVERLPSRFKAHHTQKIKIPCLNNGCQ